MGQGKPSRPEDMQWLPRTGHANLAQNSAKSTATSLQLTIVVQDTHPFTANLPKVCALAVPYPVWQIYMIADALKCSAQKGSQQTWGLGQGRGYARTAHKALPALHLCYHKRYNVYCVL